MTTSAAQLSHDMQMSHPIDMAISSGAFKEDEIPKSMSQYLSRVQVREAYRSAAQKSQAVQDEAKQPIPDSPHTQTSPSQPVGESRLV